MTNLSSANIATSKKARGNHAWSLTSLKTMETANSKPPYIRLQFGVILIVIVVVVLSLVGFGP